MFATMLKMTWIQSTPITKVVSRGRPYVFGERVAGLPGMEDWR